MSPIPTEVLQSLRAYINYGWHEESRHYEENDRPDGHMFLHVQRVENWLREQSE